MAVFPLPKRPPRARLRLALALALASAAIAAPSSGHRLAPSLLSVEEARDGTLAVVFKTPRQRAPGSEVAPELPARCAPSGTPEVAQNATSLTLRFSAACGDGGLVGARFGVSGLAASATNALLRIALADGRRMQAVLHAGAPAFVVPERLSAWEVFRDYLRLGAAHIATGFDHLLFVFGLLLLVSGARTLVATVTAFTAGHSVTLSLAALGFVRLPSAWIEVAIAATLLAVALELARPEPRPDAGMRRRPWLVAFAFGLLHGLGFAGALAEIGLPEGEIPLALFSFNVGIELGQLVFVGGVEALRALAAPRLGAAPRWLLRVPVTAIGALASYWCLDRAAALF